MTELADILHPTLEIIGNKLGIAELLQSLYANTNSEYHIKNYGAVSDGITDDSSAVLATVAAAMTTGGCVVFPKGITRIRQPIVISGSVTTDFQPVFLRGMGEYATVILWDPANTAHNCVRFYESGDAYAGGGVLDLTIANTPNTCTGKGIYITDGYRQIVSNVWIEGFLGTGGTGLFVDGVTVACQHLHLLNTHLHGCYNAYDIDGVQEMSALKLNVNQCSNTLGIFRSGTFNWHLGLVQGDKPMEFRPTVEDSITFKQYGCYHEVVGSVNTIKAYAATTGLGYGGLIKICDATNNGSYTWVDADHYDLHLEDIKFSVNPMVLKAVSSSLVGVNLTPDASKFDLDAATKLRCSWIGRGNISLGTPGPTHPDLTHTALNLGAPFVPASYTQTQRNALTPSASWELYNSTSKQKQTYNGTKWKSASTEDVRDILGATLLAQWDGRYGVAPNTWTDRIGARTLTGTGSPVFGADGGSFNGEGVWKFVAASTQYMDTGALGASILATAASSVYVRMVWRAYNTSTSAQAYLNLANGAASAISLQWHKTGGGGTGWAAYVDPSHVTSDLAMDTNPRMIEFGINAGVLFQRINGGSTVTASSGLSTTSAVGRVVIGGFAGGVQPVDASIASLLICNAKPSADQLSALDEFDTNAYGIAF